MNISSKPIDIAASGSIAVWNVTESRTSVWGGREMGGVLPANHSCENSSLPEENQDTPSQYSHLHP